MTQDKYKEAFERFASNVPLHKGDKQLMIKALKDAQKWQKAKPLIEQYTEAGDKATQGEIEYGQNFTDNGEYSHCDIIKMSDGSEGKCIAQVLNGYDAEYFTTCANLRPKFKELLGGE